MVSKGIRPCPIERFLCRPTSRYGYLEIGQTEQALLFADRSMELDTEIASVRVTAAWIYRDLGEYEKARQAFREALRLDPDNAYARDGLKALVESEEKAK